MRLIDADALKEEWIKDTGRAFPADYFIFTIDRSPTIDAVPVVRGEWIKRVSEEAGTMALCPKCGYQISWRHKTKFCPDCGAKMK